MATPAVTQADGSRAERLLERFAPVFVQHLADGERGRDRPTRIDFDGDWRTDNNWDNQARLGADAPAVVYSSAVLSTSHAFLTYTLYYPRDWTSPVCLPFICHDNDLENLRVVVELGDEPAADRLAWLEAKAHLGFRDVAGDDVWTDARGRPVVRVEPQGHGIQPCQRDDSACRPGKGRLVYAHGSSSVGHPAMDYQLLPLGDALWSRRSLDEDTGLWAAGETGPLWYRGKWSGRMGHALGVALKGRRFVHGSVRPPWGIVGKDGNRGDWFFDPAQVAKHVREDGHLIATEYTFNPYLDSLAGECREGECTRLLPPEEQGRGTTYAAYGVLGLVMLTSLTMSRGRLRRMYGSRRLGSLTEPPGQQG